MTTPLITPALDAAGRSLLFTDARTVNEFSSEPVSRAQLAEVWELARWAPTSANVQPLRIVWVDTPASRERLLPHMAEFNRAKTASAQATAVLAVDRDFHDTIPRVLPYAPEMRDNFLDEDGRAVAATFNGAMQSAYFILAVRAAGLMAGPMLGFDPIGMEAEFMADANWRPILVVNVGHPGENPWFDRLPRLEPDEVVRHADARDEGD